MPTFRYSALKADKQRHEGDIRAETTEEAVSKLKSEGYFPTSVRHIASSPIIVCVMGPTCVGKSTLFKHIGEKHNDVSGLVEVGKQMRAKYPPDYFKGLNNPKHTAAEAWQMCEIGVNQHLAAGKDYVFVDGQPRDVDQVHLMLKTFNVPVKFVLMHATAEVCEQRARINRADDPANLELALARIRNDRVSYYDVLATLLGCKVVVDLMIDTSNTSGTPDDCEAFYRRMCALRD